ncbi:MAG: 2Fe-2S iron-sulfur cluster binding domain-containing protein [Burkholderiales bacterium]|nr:2Fe-2S iron-sulfur cluster binding domain-containing protein [Burkholderiales bacterium]
MSFEVTIEPSGHSFTTGEDETVLAAALREGFVLPYGCRNGACGSCKGKIVSGTVDYGNPQPAALAEFEKSAGYALFCQAKPTSDLVIEAREIGAVGELEVRRLPCRVQHMHRAADEIMILKLKLPANERLQFLAGQYIDILLRNGKRRSYSMANPPHDDEFVELHVRNMQHGAFTEHVFGGMKEKEILRFEGPLGTFFLQEDSDKPMILVASGTGFAPIKSIVEHAFHVDIARTMTLYWGGRRPHDLYMAELAGQWQERHDNFTFIPVISDALPEDRWTGRSGFVHRAVMEDFPDMSGYQVYACGAPVMVEAAHRDFTAQCELPDDEFFSDAFTPSVDPKPAAE